MSNKKNDFQKKCIDGCYQMAIAMQDARQAAGITQQEMANKIGATRVYIGNIEQNRVKIPAYIVYEYCRILQVPPDKFFKLGTENMDLIQDITIRLNTLPKDMLEGILHIIQAYDRK